jgi:hypothetical protein
MENVYSNIKNNFKKSRLKKATLYGQAYKVAEYFES